MANGKFNAHAVLQNNNNSWMPQNVALFFQYFLSHDNTCGQLNLTNTNFKYMDFFQKNSLLQGVDSFK